MAGNFGEWGEKLETQVMQYEVDGRTVTFDRRSLISPFSNFSQGYVENIKKRKRRVFCGVKSDTKARKFSY